jgi:predicted secreted protein with PEFG-CTERM motif
MTINLKNYFVISILILSASSMAQNHVFADGTNNFGILASSFINTSSGTSITGDVGYTTGPAVVPIISGSTHVADSVYSIAGTAQNTATSFANSQVCTSNLGTSVDLSIVHGGIYTPGVYCTTGAASIGTGGITLSGDGIYIFKIDGALTTVVNSIVHLNGAQASNISWVPTQATTLGADSKFAGTILDASGVTIGNNVNINGKVLAFGGTVSTNADTITVPSSTMSDKISNNFQCTVTFPTGAIDLGSNVQYSDKVYPPGVYCIDGAANIGSGPITLTGSGAHVFEITGAFNQAANTSVILSKGAQVSSVIWVPSGPTTIGANSHLVGTVNGAPITIGANSDINGAGLKIMSDAISGNFAILSSTYTNTSPGTSILGDLGYTTGPAVVPIISGSTHVADSVYSQAGIVQKAMTSYANSQVCTTNLGTTVDLSLMHGGVYTPGVYCTTGAASIGTGGITLSGNGVYIFQIKGALTTVSDSVVHLNGAQASDVSWVPTAATTLGADSKFAGTIIDASGVTIGNSVSMAGRVLAFGGTVSTNADTITVSSSTMSDKISGNFQCTVTFPTGAIDLGSNVQYPDKVYPPGVYCIDGAANIGSGPITLTGSGAHVFKINGALGQAANTSVILSKGAQVSSVIWMPTGPTTIGANSHLIGTVNGAPITIGANSDIIGAGSKTMADTISGNFAILSSTYTNTVIGTIVGGDLGYTTGPVVVPIISGATHVADAVSSLAGTAQNAATSYANSRVCTTNLGTTVDLSLIHNGVYSPGVYCTTGAASIGAGGITLSGNGVYIFQIKGALTTVANSAIHLNGAQASDVSWVPTGATTLGADSTFAGIILDAAGVTINHNVDMTGRVLAFGGTVSTSADTITVPSSTMSDTISGNFAILSSTYTNTSPGTSIAGDLGFTTGPALPSTVNGIIHTADNAYSQAGVAQNVAISDANSQVCTTNLGTTVDLSLIHNGVYTPGVYCTTGAASIGAGGITLSGNGIYIFKIDGALTTVSKSIVYLNGAQASNISWVPTGATTLGANTKFAGIILDASGITISKNVDMTGRVLAFGGTVSTNADTITVPSYAMADAISGNFQCTVTFPTGAIDLGSNVQYPDKVYPPGVYCIDGAANIGSGPITLTGNGAHIFKINGALDQATNTDVILANGAVSSSVIWVPAGPTTIGANSHLIGTVNGAPITIGANSDINGIGPAKVISDAISNNFQCTVTFPTGAIDLGSNVQYADKVYPPGVYCIDGAANIGSGPITLTGNGAHIFKINGALNQAANTDVILTSGAQSSSIIWIPSGPTTIGANSHLIGTVNGAPITIGANSDINGIGPAKVMADAISTNSQCTITFPTGAIDLGSNVQYADKVYPPGVYCIDGAANIGSGPITLTGNGAHIFKINGALNQAANTDVILANGAVSSSVIWVPTGAITIGANSNLVGIVNGAPITIGANSAINGIVPQIMADATSGNFAILSSTYTNTSPGTSISGDLGYTTKPAVSATIDGIVHMADSVYSQAGTAQNAATSYANSQVCTTNLGTTVDLSLVHNGVYTPGVYCTTGAASIGAGGITLSGNGIYIFKIDGALTTVVNSAIHLDGAQASDVSWVPTGATTLGADSTFAGIILDAAGVTINHNVNMAGRVLAFGGTVSTSADTITVPSYAMADAASGNLPCTVTFPTGAIDLGSNVPYPDKVYPPGVYCIDGAANIGSGPITLTGSGAHIFKINGALDQATNTDVILANGAVSSSVIWVPTGAITIGANSHLIGTVNGAPITIGANSDINGVGPAKTMADATAIPSGPLYATGDTTVPEFGTIATMILIMGIASIIAVSARTRLRITPSY